ncbi:hypothetical protein LA5095_02713 [Roseibium album]|uniref:Uncharacterized protein n=1 Tax=Roseibium album TaxID=311410 RepID=A0A0M7ADQ2_9HYPH|nr:hypothetical protein LA5094_01659 [Roseibium album]CTQ63635.1 hypothetical protein LA5096_00082 [Roseibium album]CTQ73218.1 hypothetical protein LA5095_02713 [Roseibium album]
MFQPKGGLCANCIFATRCCAHLDFASMPVIKIYPDGVKAVKCSEYSKRL